MDNKDNSNNIYTLGIWTVKPGKEKLLMNGLLLLNGQTKIFRVPGKPIYYKIKIILCILSPMEPG